MSPQILLIRHGEKPTGSTEGVKHDGTSSKHSLSPRGWARAGALARFFVPLAERTGNTSLAVPRVLIAASPDAPGADRSEKSKREEETISPVAELLKVAPNLDFGKGEEAKVAAYAMASNDPVLIVWEHEAIPELARAISPAANVPGKWPSARFDMVWVFNLNSEHAYDFEQVPQLLLAGDSAEPIA